MLSLEVFPVVAVDVLVSINESAEAFVLGIRSNDVTLEELFALIFTHVLLVTISIEELGAVLENNFGGTLDDDSNVFSTGVWSNDGGLSLADGVEGKGALVL